MGKTRENVILVGDIGGTHTRLAIIDIVKGRFHFLAEQTFLEPGRAESGERPAKIPGQPGPAHHGGRFRRRRTGPPGPLRSHQPALGNRFPGVGPAAHPPPGRADQ